MKKKRIIVSAISDLATDQRVHKVCLFLTSRNVEVSLIGRRLGKDIRLNRPYTTSSIRCYFKRGVLKYLEFNTKLFVRLLFAKADILLSNDLDTLVPNYVISNIRRKRLVYDSHEYFTGIAELAKSDFKKNIWAKIERTILPKIKTAYTVNESVSRKYAEEYGVEMKVVRNLPLLKNEPEQVSGRLFPAGKKILLMQGMGINEGRGYEEAVEAMQLLSDEYLLVIIGSGTILSKLREMTKNLKIEQKVQFMTPVPFEQLNKITRQADLGLTLDKPVALNNLLSLPNKLFDYIHAGVPVLASNLPEISAIISKYEVGMCVEEVKPDIIAKSINSIFDKKTKYDVWRCNTAVAAKELCWQNEEKQLNEIFSGLL
jgi:glycosyltransferase involved in cell wall biosynthesis